MHSWSEEDRDIFCWFQKKVKEDNWSPTHRNECNVYKKQKAWQKQKTGLEKANKQQYLQDTNTHTHFRTINTLQYAEYTMGWARRLPENQCSSTLKMKKWRPDNTNVTDLKTMSEPMVMKEEALAKILNKLFMKYCWCWTWEKRGLVKLAKIRSVTKLVLQEKQRHVTWQNNSKVKFVHHRGPNNTLKPIIISTARNHQG